MSQFKIRKIQNSQKSNLANSKIKIHEIQKSQNSKFTQNTTTKTHKLNTDSHPPVFEKKDYKDILKRLNKLEKEK